MQNTLAAPANDWRGALEQPGSSLERHELAPVALHAELEAREKGDKKGSGTPDCSCHAQV